LSDRKFAAINALEWSRGQLQQGKNSLFSFRTRSGRLQFTGSMSRTPGIAIQLAFEASAEPCFLAFFSGSLQKQPLSELRRVTVRAKGGVCVEILPEER
jgi:hypothetical protein